MVTNHIGRLLIFAVVLSACAAPPPRISDIQASAIGIAIKDIYPFDPREVYFVKVDKEVDLFEGKELVVSNYARHGQFYLLNAKPGRYVAVACLGIPRGRGQGKIVTLFSKDLIKKTDILVTSGSIAFMGEYVIPTRPLVDNIGDDAQKHYFQLREPDAPTGVYLNRLWMMTVSPTGYALGFNKETNHDVQTETTFFTEATADPKLKEAGWSEVIKQRLDSLRAR